MMTKRSLFLRAGALAAALLALLVAPALGADGGGSGGGGSRPLHLSDAGSSNPVGGGGGGSLVRTIVGLAIVIAVIYGVTWVLRQLKASKQERAVGGLRSVATVPLGSGRALHLVRAGNELVLVGAGEHGVTPVRTYTEQEARDAGLVDEWGDLIAPDGAAPAGPAAPAAPRAARGAGRAGGLKLAQLSPGTMVATMRRWTVRR
jgi:flagellar protein FliO/FliZ